MEQMNRAVKDLAVITGASAGIGLATACRFIDSGYEVVCMSRRPCPREGVESLAVDLASPDSTVILQDWIAKKIRRKRRIVLIHNASTSWHDSAESVDLEELRSMLNLSVVAAAGLNQLLLPSMTEGSSVIYLGSTLSTKAVPDSFSYITAKHAVVGMMRATCQDLFGKGVHTVCICPGTTDTEMLRSLFSEEILQRLGRMASVGRLILPDEIAEVIFMAANTPVLNGTLIDANYGQREQ